MMLQTGEVLSGRFRIVREIGSGGFGRVYLAEELERGTDTSGPQASLGFGGDEPLVLRQVAIKILVRSRLRRDLRAELRALCRLSHPNIVSVYDYQLADPAWLAMEYVVGRDLQTWLEEGGPLGTADAIAVALQVGEALAHAHAAGILHRDVKPSNVILSEASQAKLVDFGLARSVERQDPTTQEGTPGFVAPELLDPDRFPGPIGVTVDVYGLGCLLYALLTGEALFAGNSPLDTLRKQLADERREIEGHSPLLSAALQRATALAPSDRFPSVPAFLEALRRARDWALRPASPGIAANSRIDVTDGQLLSIEPFRHPQRGRGLRFQLLAAGGRIAERGFLYEGAAGSQARDVFESLGAAWAGSELSVYGALRVESAEKGAFLSGDAQTVPIVEPHFLVSATDIVKSQGVGAGDCAARTFVDARDVRPPSRAQVVGRLLHDMLDRLVEEGAQGGFDYHFEAALAGARIDAVAAGLGDGDLEQLQADLDAPFRWLEGFVGRQVRGAGSLVEATRFSGRYGLEGRIDLALLSETRLEIVELKSGRKQTAEHDAQLRCYTLLWDAFAESTRRRVNGRLIYSQNGIERTVTRKDHLTERHILRARNQIVAAHRALARGDLERAMPHHGQWPERCADAPCRFRAEHCAQQSGLIGLGRWADAVAAAGPGAPWDGISPELVQAARDYYRHFSRLVALEYEAESRAQGSFTRPSALGERIRDGVAVADARLVEWDAGLKAIQIACEDAQRFTPGSDVVLHRGDPDADATALGRVARVEAGRLVVSCDGADAFAALPRDGWVIERYSSRLGWRESQRALLGLLMVRRAAWLRAFLFGDDREPTRRFGAARVTLREPSELLHRAASGGLNEAQQAAINLALDEPSQPVLIHGPPGTGKTTVIAALIESLVGRGQRVLVAAGTNTAVDNVLERLLGRGVDFLRLGRAGADTRIAALSAVERAGRVEAKLSRRTPSLDAIAARLRTVPVVAGTAHRCIRSGAIDALRRWAAQGTKGGEPPPPFDVAVVDEATQLTEPLALGVTLLARRFVLVGDKRQLPPVIAADEARTPYVRPMLAPPLLAMGVGGLDFTLFERLEGRAPEAALAVQYRMSREVQEISNRLYYENALQADTAAAVRRLPLRADVLAALSTVLRQRLDPERPVVWETLLGSGQARLNEAETAAACETIAALVEAHPDGPGFASQVGVISPFRAQCHAIRQALAKRVGADVAGRIEVDTVERFQGREKEVMVVSLVVSTWSDFVMDDRRLNVAFTRARSKLVVFGPGQLRYRIETAGRWGNRQ